MQSTLRLWTSSLLLFLSTQANSLVGEFLTPTLDSAQTRAVYGIETFQNKSSAVTVTVPGGYVQLEASKIASDGTEGWTAEVGLRLPLDPQGGATISRD